MPEQLLLWGDASEPDGRERRVAMTVQELLAIYHFRWFSCEDFARDTARHDDPKTVERRWGRLRAELRLLGVPFESRTVDWAGDAHNKGEMRFCAATKAWVEDVFPPWADEGFVDPDDPEDTGQDLTWSELADRLNEEPRNHQ